MEVPGDVAWRAAEHLSFIGKAIDQDLTENKD
jgi:hypothetical protein